jgi:heme exporter protein D
MLDGIQFSSFGEFLAMGGYAFNVWTVYLLFLIFLLVNLVGPLQRRKRIMRELQRRALLAEEQPDSTE